MSTTLCYLVIVQPQGLPLYARSFDFRNDDECRSFNGRLTRDDAQLGLFGSYFQVIKNLTGEVIAEDLRIIDLGFSSFQIKGIAEEGCLFLGIFELVDPDQPVDVSKLTRIMQRITERFIEKYPASIREATPVNESRFNDFTDEITELGAVNSPEECRDCLTKCVDENKGCMPHLIYFENAKSLEKSEKT